MSNVEQFPEAISQMMTDLRSKIVEEVAKGGVTEFQLTHKRGPRGALFEIELFKKTGGDDVR